MAEETCNVISMFADHAINTLQEAEKKYSSYSKVTANNEDNTIKTLQEELAIKEERNQKILALIEQKLKLLEEKEKELEATVTDTENSSKEEMNKLNSMKTKLLEFKTMHILKNEKFLLRTTFDFNNKNVNGYMVNDKSNSSAFLYDREEMSRDQITESLWEKLKTFNSGS